MNVVASYINKTFFFSSNILAFFDKKFSNIIAILSLLFLFSCSDRSCIDANDFGEYKTEYLTVKPDIGNQCTYSLSRPTGPDSGQSNINYYEPTASFKEMKDSVDFDKFLEIISAEYRNLLNSNNISEIQYSNFFTIFSGDLKNADHDGDGAFEDYITGQEYSIEINQKDMIIINDKADIINSPNNPDSLKLNKKDMISFLYGESSTEIDRICNKNNQFCSFIPNIIDQYKWVSKSASLGGGRRSVLGCIMEQQEDDGNPRANDDGLYRNDPNDTKSILESVNNKKLYIKYPPLDVFLQCVKKAIDKCNLDKISKELKDINSSSSNDKLARSNWYQTNEYNKNISSSLYIGPESNIYIKAIGDINLGSNSSYPDMFAASYLLSSNKSTSLKLQSNNNNDQDFSNWKNFVHSSVNLTIEGGWKKDGDIYSISTSADDESIKNSYNALSRLAIYIDDSNNSSAEVSFTRITNNLLINPSTNYTSVEYSSDNFTAFNFNFNHGQNFGLDEVDSNTGNLISAGKLKMHINDKEICLNQDCKDHNSNPKVSINNIMLRSGDILKIDILTSPTSSKRVEVSMESILNDHKTKDIFTFRHLNDDSNLDHYISNSISISGLYSIAEPACYDNKFILNNTDIYQDMKEEEISATDSRVYLRKGQRIYLKSKEGNNCSNIPSLTLLHKRPAFLCKKRGDSFAINNPFCAGNSRAYCVSKPNDDCVNSSSQHYCDISLGNSEDARKIAITEIINICKSDVTYDETDPENISHNIGNSCIELIKSKCQTKYSSQSSSDNCKTRCQSCVNLTFNPVNNSGRLIEYPPDKVDICYDLENYTGKVSDISPNILGNKGARELFFNGSYGNFVKNGSFLLNPDAQTSEKYSGSLNLSKKGKVKFLVVNNENLDLHNSSLFVDSDDKIFDSTSSNDNGNGYLIKFDNIENIYSNGQMMESYLCKTPSACSALLINDPVINSVDNSSIIGISALEYDQLDAKYKNKCVSPRIINGLDSDLYSDFGYYLNKFGILEEMNKKSATHCLNNKMPDNTHQARKYFSNDKNKIQETESGYQLYFSIIDDQENNCIIYKDSPSRTSSGECTKNIDYNYLDPSGNTNKCNGVKTENPYYMGEKTNCNNNGSLILNPHYESSSTDANINICPINCQIQSNTSLDKNVCNSAISFRLQERKIEEYLCSKNCSIPTLRTGKKISSNDNDSSNFCQEYDISRCNDRKYYCAGKLFDNTGSYNLEVKVKNNGRFTSLIHDMMSPITDIIYGSPQTCIEGKRILDIEGKLIGTCHELNNNNLFIDLSSARKYDFNDRAKEFVIFDNNHNPILKYDNILVKSVCDNCIKNLPYNIAISEGHVYQYGERIRHPDEGYVIRKGSMSSTFYNNVINNDLYAILFKTLMVIALMFYGGSYLMGMSEFSKSEIMTKMVKLSIILLFLSPGGWHWFQNIFVSFFESGADYLSLLMVSAFESEEVVENARDSVIFDPTLLFASFDRMIALLSPVIFYKVTALFFSSIFGWLYLLIIFFAGLMYFQTAIKVMLLYLSAKLFINFTFVLAPILLLFLLFEQTKDTFNKWIKQVASFSMQQIIILFSFTLFNVILYSLIKSVLAYKVCWGTVWQINILVKMSLLKWWTIAGDMSNPVSASAPGLLSILMLLFMVMIMAEFVGNATGFAERLVDGFTVDSIQNAITSQMNKSFKAAMKTIDFAAKKIGGGAILGKYGIRDRAMGVLFNAGKGVDEKNREALAAEREANALRGRLKKVEKKAIQNFKNKELSQEGGLYSKDKNMIERIEKLENIGKSAMIEELKNYHLSKGKPKSNSELKRELDHLLDPNYKSANWSHDSLSSLLMAKMSSHGNKISDNKHDNKRYIKSAEITNKDVKNSYEQFNKKSPADKSKNIDQMQKAINLDTIDKMKKGLEKKSRFTDSVSERFVRNIDKIKNREEKKFEKEKGKKEGEENQKKERGEVSKRDGAYFHKNAWSYVSDKIIDPTKDKYKDKKEAIANLLDENARVPYMVALGSAALNTPKKIDKLSGNRFSALKNLPNRGLKDAKKDKARILAENILKTTEGEDGKMKITLEKDQRQDPNYEFKEYMKERKESKRKKRKTENATWLDKLKDYKTGNTFLTTMNVVTSKTGNTFLTTIEEMWQTTKKGAKELLVNTGLRNEWTAKEKDLIDKKVADINKRGGVEKLEERVQEIVDYYDTNPDKVKKEIGSVTKDKIEEQARNFLLKEEASRDWRNEIWSNKDLDYGSHLAPYIGKDANPGRAINLDDDKDSHLTPHLEKKSTNPGRDTINPDDDKDS